MKKLLIINAIAVVLFATACSKKSDTATTGGTNGTNNTTGAASLSMKIDNADWKTATTKLMLESKFALGGSIAINHLQSIASNGTQLNIYFPDRTGTTALSYQSDYYAVYSDGMTFQTTSGSMNVTKMDQKTGVCTASFSFTGDSKPGSTGSCGGARVVKEFKGSFSNIVRN
ncbi:MAG: hypothetical protein NTX03_06520 [Bacteroidetes bacterium]|nr:hypothetical protein [Bacteroidota bacterium]